MKPKTKTNEDIFADARVAEQRRNQVMRQAEEKRQRYSARVKARAQRSAAGAALTRVYGSHSVRGRMFVNPPQEGPFIPVLTTGPVESIDIILHEQADAAE